MKNLSKTWEFIKSSIKSRDMYSKTISFTYEGNDNYSTLVGGLTRELLKNYNHWFIF